jgi:general secretion pathway protein A
MPDAKYYFPSAMHEEALARIRYAYAGRKGAIVLDAAAGMGKTFLARCFASGLQAPVAFVRFAGNTSVELLRPVVRGFSVPHESEHVTELLGVLERFVADAARAGPGPLLVLDNAQMVRDVELLNVLRLMTEFESPSGPPLTILLLSRESTLSQKKQSNPLFGRVGMTCSLKPLGAQEIPAYVLHRIHVAGGAPGLFEEKALSEIAASCPGVPSRLNSLCDLALFMGFAEKAGRVSVDIVKRASEENCDRPGTP